MENIALYTHQTDLDVLKNLLELYFGKVKEANRTARSASFSVAVGKTLFSKGKTLTFNCRQRENYDYQLNEATDAITQNLVGMSNMVHQLELKNKDTWDKMLAKLATINTEIAVLAEPNFMAQFSPGLNMIVKSLDAIVFSGQNNLFPNAITQGFYNRDLEFLFDLAKNESTNSLDVAIKSTFFDRHLSAFEEDNNTEISERQQARKAGAMEMLQQMSIPVNGGLPFTPNASEVKMRSQDEIIDRALAIFICSVKAEGGDIEQSKLEEIGNGLGILDKLSPKEKAFFYNETNDEHLRINTLWHYEALWTLFWALGFINEQYAAPTQICPVEEIAKFVISNGADGMRKMAKLRDTDTILDQLDLTYRCHWAVVNARIKGQESPAGLEPGIVYERHYALNWLTCFQNEDNVLWDDVNTPT